MSVLSYDHQPSQQTSARAFSIVPIVHEAWRRTRSWLLLALPIFLLFTALVLVSLGLRTQAANRAVTSIRAGDDIAVGVDARPELLLARIQFLLAHDRVDEVQPYVEALDRQGSDEIRAIAHYDLANGRLRQAFDEVTATRLDKAGPFVVLARQEYRRALTLEPEMWDAKFNLDVASRLIRDFPAFERTMGDEVKTKKKLWTDVPGKPEGLP